jgi:hypothetical protein
MPGLRKDEGRSSQPYRARYTVGGGSSTAPPTPPHSAAGNQNIPWKTIGPASAVVGLLALAALGVVFGTHKRTPKNDDVPVNLETPIVARVENPEILSPTPPAKQSKKVEAPIIDIEMPWNVAHAAEAPEVLPGPREHAAEPKVEVLEIQPMVVVEKPSPETTTGPDNPAKTPPAIVVGKKPRSEVEEKLSDTTKPKFERFGTKIDFLPAPVLAYEKARKDKEKLVLILHYAGSADAKGFTESKAESLREDALADDDVAEFVNEHMVCSYMKISAIKDMKGGNVVTWFCLSDGTAVHAIPGAVDAKQFLEQAKWIVDVRKKALLAAKGEPTRAIAVYRRAHAEKFFEEFLPPGIFPDSAPIPNQTLFNNLPPRRPISVSAQAQVHWMLARRNAPKLADMYKSVYQDILGEKIVPDR